MATLYSQNWDLNTLFPGGSQSSELQVEFEKLSAYLRSLSQILTQSTDFPRSIFLVQQIESCSLELDAFISCLLAQDVQDQLAVQLNDRLTFLRAQQEDLTHQFNCQLLKLSEQDFLKLIQHPDLQPIKFSLEERRVWAKEKLSLKEESLINQLSINGYQGWHEIYSAVIGQIRIPFQNQLLSVGQAENKLSHPDRTLRESLFQQWEATWKTHEELFSQILNHLAGFRLQVYQARGWNHPLKEPLFYNRMQEQTLQAMWTTIEQHKKPLELYLNRKAELLGLSQLAWFDIDASLSPSISTVPFQEAAESIIEQFNQFSPAMGEFAKQAFIQRWIETEDRPGKRPGGFCSQHPQSQVSRIFMTYSGVQANVFTLAHELGHAYHNYVVRDLPIMAQQYRMNVAETASTLAETILIDSLINTTVDPQQKLSLLDNKIQRSVVFLMNIHARFLFETRFYERRKKGFVLAHELNQLMEEAQKEAFHGCLSTWHPHFWVAKLHFYLTDVPFYNFPYTFGYLFSLGIYAEAKKEGKNFGQRYEQLLKDTGSMTVEELAHKHLGVDLTKPIFWQQALGLIQQDIDTFMQLSH